MKISKIFKYISFLAVVFPLFSTACQRSDSLPSRGGNSPKYLLTGTLSASSGDFDYYSINNDTEYAVALKSTLISSTAERTIPSQFNSKPVTGIWRGGFYNSHTTKVNIPSSIKTIDYEAFMGSRITSLTVPASVSAIGEGAFYYCKSLTKAIIQNSTTSSEASSACSCIGSGGDDGGQRSYSTLKLIPSFCFFNCVNLKELVLPESIEEIEYEAFNNCYALFSTLAFANIKTIRSRAFQDCKALKKVYISSSFFEEDETTHEPVGIMEENAFIGCNSNLEFYLVGDSNDITIWRGLSRNANWNIKDEHDNPGTQNLPDVSGSNRYVYHITSAGASYTNDWIYTITNGEVEITSYIGPTEIEGNPVEFITFPDELPSGSGNKVRYIALNALDSVRANLKRIYLPKTLKRIESTMFGSTYTNLVVIDDNQSSKCTSDEALVEAEQDLTPRIILNGITDLEVIGNSAFVNLPKLTQIKKLYLPYSLKAVGRYAFGSSDSGGKHMQAVTEFIWDYDDTKSALEVIGRNAFYLLGNNSGQTSYTKANLHQDYLANNGTKNYQLTTLVIPRTFKHFGITSTDNSTYNLGGVEGNDANFGITAFAGCPLISTVIFKGSKKTTVQSATDSTIDGETADLFIASQTFVMNQSLRTVVFEERCGRHIVFHANSTSYQPAIGWSAGKAKNDFNGDPAIQTIVLPNTYTTLHLQPYAMQGNSRGVVYFSGSYNDGTKDQKLYGIKNTVTYYDTLSNPDTSDCRQDIRSYQSWRLIGDESALSNNYYGYHFNYASTKNAFGINQKMPQYVSVLYKDTVTVNGTDVDVEVGTGNTREFVIKDKCAIVCNTATNKATMANYLYDRHDNTFTGEAKVPATVTDSNSTTYNVTIIGASAFSAAYCDGNSYKNHTNYKDLTSVLIPAHVTEIGEYAFMRAYGVTKLSAYNVSTGVSLGDYIMPTSMNNVGKHAFAFCNIKQFLNFKTDVQFYETKSSNSATDTSVFTNNFSLRKITFGNDATYSNNYVTTTYTHSGSSDTYTSALYSKNTSKNSYSLLIVLNRDSNDRLSESEDLDDTTVTVGIETVHYAEFDGQHEIEAQHATHYLYGAFKMCYWVDSLIVGTASTLSETTSQPLISGIYNVAGNKDTLVYLNNGVNFTDNKNSCRLKAISFGGSSTLSTPTYSFEGCNQLEKVRLPRLPGQKLPAGLFALIERDIVFEVPAAATGDTFKECAAGVLDLQFTGYSGIETEAFKGTGIKTVIAPQSLDGEPNDFVIEQDAFANCEDLVKVDFSHVTGTVTLNASFRGAKINNDLFDFGSSALIEFGDEAFKGAKFPGHTFDFPVKTAVIGTSCFEGCNVGYNTANDYSLQTVTASGGNLTSMKSIKTAEAIDAEDSTRNNWDKKDDGFKQIGNFAFYLCYGLTSFDFSKFTELERIGHYAFSMNNFMNSTSINTDHKKSSLNDHNFYAATICTNGEVVLPASLTNLGVGVFHTTKITSVTIQSSSIKFERGGAYSKQKRLQTDKGGHQFRYCPLLTKVFFSNRNCEWHTVWGTKGNGGQDNYFSNCDSLAEVYLPRYVSGVYNGYDMQHYGNATENQNNLRPDSMVYYSNDNVKIYSYNSLKDFIGSTYNFYMNKFWHRTRGTDASNNSVVAAVVFYVEDYEDVVRQVNGVWTEIDPAHEYWTVMNGESVYLGTYQGVTVNNDVVTVTLGYTKGGVTYTYQVTSSGVSVAP